MFAQMITMAQKQRRKTIRLGGSAAHIIRGYLVDINRCNIWPIRDNIIYD